MIFLCVGWQESMKLEFDALRTQLADCKKSIRNLEHIQQTVSDVCSVLVNLHASLFLSQMQLFLFLTGKESESCRFALQRRRHGYAAIVAHCCLLWWANAIKTVSYLLSWVELASHKAGLSSTSLPHHCGKPQPAEHTAQSAEAHGSHSLPRHRWE